jgi:hypothetical protein
MKMRDISLVVFGAIAAASVMIAASVIFYTPRAQAQAASTAPAPGGVSVTVTSGNINVAAGSTAQNQGGTIMLQDTVNRKVIIYAYSYNIFGNGTAPSMLFSSPSSFQY